MMKKYISMSIVLFQLTYIFPAEKQRKRTSDPKKCRIILTQSQPIFIAATKAKDNNRLSQSSPPYLHLSPSYSDAHSPNEYCGLGNLGEDFSPAAYDSKR